MDVIAIRKDFPFLQQKIKGQPVIYFDNAATTQKPVQVLNTIREFYSRYNAAVNRSTHTISNTASLMYGQAHEKAARFIGAGSYREIIFTRNATEGINMVCYSLMQSKDKSIGLSAGDEIIVPIMEHHSNFVPWQRLKESTGITIRYLELSCDGIIDPADVKKSLSKKTKLVCCSHVSNVLGGINPVKEISSVAREAGALFFVDGTQSAPHLPVNVREIGCDFFAFSGHKMLGPTGIGVLYGKKDLLEKMPPFLFGGGMIKDVSIDSASWNELPWKFEAGTPDSCGAVALCGASDPESGERLEGAIDYLEGVGMDNIRSHENELCECAASLLSEMKEVVVYGKGCGNKSGIISFNIEKNGELIDSHIIANFLNEEGIAVRSGGHCAYPLMKNMGIEGTVRASFYLYNTRDEVERFAKTLRVIIEKKLI